MASRKEQTKERKVLVTIRSGRKTETFETWKYWEIVGALQWMGASRTASYDAAKWVQKREPGDVMVIEPPGIEMVVKEECE